MIIRWIDLILYIICGITLIMASMDLHQLNKIRHDVLDACNEYYQGQISALHIVPNSPIQTWKNFSLDVSGFDTQKDYG